MAESMQNVRFYRDHGEMASEKEQNGENRITAGRSRELTTGLRNGKKRGRNKHKRAGSSKRRRKSEDRLRGGKVNMERQSGESFSRDGQNENRVSEELNRESYSRDSIGRTRPSGETMSRESYSRGGRTDQEERASGECGQRLPALILDFGINMIFSVNTMVILIFSSILA
ncbi:hypothetical protein KIN20_027093 [Parelaphostrongylus tenuis]|uniref:Uncharacterized protein n=1 Tax=Parelaphostrongylus tenuis TaxID=148309 RepID=A0AAD5QYY0_PARTN|nr:hypothetical protein KIN20_027093 [Parelaphostrongylus tenuis]